jgi:MFS family permease
MQTTDFSTNNASIQRGPRTFYTLAAAQTISQIGSNMSFLAVGIYLYQQTGQATPLAMLSLFLLLPRLLAGGVAGVLADRYDRRMLMITGDTGAAIGLLGLVISVSSGNFQIWHVYATAIRLRFLPRAKVTLEEPGLLLNQLTGLPPNKLLSQSKPIWAMGLMLPSIL